ncbi:acetylglutamate kinase [Candidatus Altiarchaeota archaeon]
MEKLKQYPESESFIQEFQGTIFVVKLGGEVALDGGLISSLASDFKVLSEVGIKTVIIHGGGPAIDKAMKKLGKEPVFVEGLRVTDEETLDIVKMVLIGKVNTELVASINRQGGKGVGLSGKSGNLFVAKKQVHKKVDLGFVGDIVKVNPELIHLLIDKGYIPVVSPIAFGTEGQSLNVNADTVAAELAVALKAKKIIFLTNISGVLDEKQELIGVLSEKEAEKLVEKKVIKGGMTPKVKAGLHALENGVEKCHLVKAEEDILLKEIFTSKGSGTMVVKG